MTGSLVYVQETETATLEVGDVITFYQEDETVVTHRIIEIVTDAEVPGGVAYRTKGDANEMEDAYLVPPENVIGKAIFGIPYLGYLAQYIQAPPGLYIAIVVGAGLILLMFLPDLFEKEEKSPVKKEEKKRKNTRRHKVRDVKEQVAKEQQDDIEIIYLDNNETKVRTVEKQPVKKKRSLTPEEKRELAKRRKMYEQRKRELAEQRIQMKEID